MHLTAAIGIVGGIYLLAIKPRLALA